jgi:GTP pyrophosphokinase
MKPIFFALTPGGEVRELPRGSTPIDFAYSIHTAVGDSCTGAKVNGHLVPLKYEIQNGDIIEIITGKNQQPKRAWLQFVKTSRARTRIRHWLRREEKEKAHALGREICERELKKHDVSLKRLVKSGHIKLLLTSLRCNSLDDMLMKVGAGKITVQHLLRALQPEEVREEERRKRENELLEKTAKEALHDRRKGVSRDAITIEGVDGMLVKISQCCKPVPGDAIMGFITTGRGVTIHKEDCPNLRNSDPQRWIDVTWSDSGDNLHRAQLFIRAENLRGLVADISSRISTDDVEIIAFNSRTTVENVAEMDVVVEVRNLAQLQSLQQHLQQLPAVIEVRRR